MPMIRDILCLLLIIISLQVIRIDSVQTDGTLVPGKSGINVVVATLERIFATSDIFDRSCESDCWFRDHGRKSLIKQFLRYKAYVDTEFGNSESPGGIWNVSMEQFLQATSHVQARDYHLGLRLNSSSLQIDWRKVGYSNMSVPMYSCLAIMLYLDAHVLNPQFPYWLKGRQQFARLWVNHLGGRGNENTWNDKVDELDTNSRCSIKSDVVFVVDASNSITEADLGEAKDMVYSYTAKLDAPIGDNRIGIILIQTTAMVYLSLDDNLTNVETLRRIEEIPYVPHHFTNTADALCKLSQQAWRYNDSSTLQVAIVLTDGRSSFHYSECEGDTETVANFIHEQYPHILVFAIGIGEESDINEIELAQIASRPHLITRLGHYEDLEFMEGSFRYEICYTLSTPINQGTESHGTVDKNQIVRWIMEGIGDDGVTIRMCIKSGRLTLYVSYLPTPSEALYDNRATIAITDTTAIDCGTIFMDTSSDSINDNNNNSPINGKRKRRQASQNSTTLYFAIVGEINNTKFSINSASGNVTIDINECQLKPHPCHESAMCFNTDGSFYCECQEGFIGDGLINCTGLTPDIIHVYNRLAVILPSVILSIIILLLLTALIVLISLKFPRRKLRKIDNCKAKVVPKVYESELQFVRENLKKVNKPISATNPLSVIE